MNEFREFISNLKENPPKEITDKIFFMVDKDLNPGRFLVFSKLSMIHILVSLITLSVCPQFGFRVLGEGMGLMHIFSYFGPSACTLACGFFFLGMTLLTATIILKPEEIRSIRKNRIVELLALAFLSLGFFLMINAEMVLGIAIIWLTGSIIGGLIFLEAGWEIRKKLLVT